MSSCKSKELQLFWISPEGIWQTQSIETTGILRTLLLCRLTSFQWAWKEQIENYSWIVSKDEAQIIWAKAPVVLFFIKGGYTIEIETLKYLCGNLLLHMYINAHKFIPPPFTHTHFFLSKYYIISLERREEKEL